MILIAAVVVAIGQLAVCVNGAPEAQPAARADVEDATARAREAYTPVYVLARVTRVGDRLTFVVLAEQALAQAPYADHTISVGGVQYTHYTAEAEAAFSAAAIAFARLTGADPDRATDAVRAARAAARALSQIKEAESVLYASVGEPISVDRAADPLLTFNAAFDAFDVAETVEAFFTAATAATRER